MHRFSACLRGGKRPDHPRCEGSGFWLEDDQAIHPACSGRRRFSVEELQPFNGVDLPEIYISYFGTVYDVTSRPDLYGRSPPGPYHLFAGRECARALATMSMAPEDVGRTDLEDLAALSAKVGAALGGEDKVRVAVAKAAREWEERFAQTYDAVGVLGQGPSQGGATGSRRYEPPPLPTPLRSCLRGGGDGRPLGGSGLHTATHGHPAASSAASTSLAGPSEGRLELLSRKPRAYLQRRFLGGAECRRLIEMTLRRQEGRRFDKKARSALEVKDPLWTAEERALLRSIDERIAEIAGAIHADEDPLIGTLTPAGKESGISDHLGLHVDTNAAQWRYCTAIIYLSSLPRGGETVFPAAVGDGLPSEEQEQAVEAAGTLLDLGVDHTDKVVGGSQEAAASAARDLLAAEASGIGMRVKPEEGTMCLFWTRLDDGEIDRHSWHGGAPVPEGAVWKWTLQKFKEVPLSARRDPGALANFVKQTRCRAADFT